MQPKSKFRPEFSIQNDPKLNQNEQIGDYLDIPDPTPITTIWVVGMGSRITKNLGLGVGIVIPAPMPSLICLCKSLAMSEAGIGIFWSYWFSATHKIACLFLIFSFSLAVQYFNQFKFKWLAELKSLPRVRPLLPWLQMR